jgi:hypothetical protein
MDHATSSRLLLTTHFATSLLPLTTRLVAVITELGRLIVSFRRADPTPRDCHRFEIRLQESFRELGRIIIEWTFNHIEPHDHKDLPGQIESGGTWYRRRSKTPNRSVATTFGTITLWRMLYQDVHGVEPSIFPLEIRLGLESGRATPALAERAARAAVTSSQDAVLATIRDDHAVRWSAETLRAVIAGVAAGMEAHHHEAQVGRLLAWLEQADRSSGDRKPVLAVGRDGLMLPIRGQACYREGATATVSVYDRRGQRLGTVYLGRMPEPGQGTLSRQLTALIEAVLGRAIAAVGLCHRWGEPPDPVLPPSAPTDERPPSSRPATELAMGDRLLSRLRIHHEAVRGVVLRGAGGGELGAEDAPMVEGEAAGDLPGVALGGGLAAAADHRIGGQAGAIPHRLRLSAEADALVGLPGLSPGSPADRQRGDGGGVQDGVHPTAEAVGDDVESGERPVDRRPAGDPLERSLERGVSILPGIESDAPNGDSTDYSEEKDLKCRIIAGTGAIPPDTYKSWLLPRSSVCKVQ